MSATSAPLDPFAVQAAKSIRRLVNRAIYDSAAQLRVADDVELEFVCECGDLNCKEIISLRVIEFDRLSKPGSVTAHQSDRGDQPSQASFNVPTVGQIAKTSAGTIAQRPHTGKRLAIDESGHWIVLKRV